MGKTTKELIESMQSSKDYQSYLLNHNDEINSSRMKIDRALSVILAEKGLKKADVIRKSGLDRYYAYQIFNGTKNPTRDKVVMLCISADMTFDEIQNLLKITGYAILYAKDRRDNVIIYGIENKKMLWISIPLYMNSVSRFLNNSVIS